MTPLHAFGLVDMRVGRIVRAQTNDKARKPSFKLWIDFGEIGTRQSSGQLTDLYSINDLVGRHVIAVINLGERNIAGFVSQVLVLGLPDESGHVVLLEPEREVPIGGRVF